MQVRPIFVALEGPVDDRPNETSMVRRGYWPPPRRVVNEYQLLSVLQWLAGPRDIASSPDLYAISEVRRLGLAREVGGGVNLTPSGVARLVELGRASGVRRGPARPSTE
jgi:hypothetical protein